ncbi:MAG: hypothetical protein A3K10_04000 [Bacteroidetes bacterium RIFCSPLOWO2_12_FULL_31_6]|nr:MAG: hypothetical protein A3K10_04000 [Bacteroidetes bacterium RIFCSPLOWO2_12_FULL_31_6]
MQVEFLEKFNRDLEKISNNVLKSALVKVIERIEKANSIFEISNVKKLSGHKSAYRIRIGDYRVGIFIDGDFIQFGRIAHRKDIYKIFP